MLRNQGKENCFLLLLFSPKVFESADTPQNTWLVPKTPDSQAAVKIAVS